MVSKKVKYLELHQSNTKLRMLIAMVAVILIGMTYMAEKPGAIEAQDRKRLRMLMGVVVVFLAILAYSTYYKGFPQPFIGVLFGFVGALISVGILKITAATLSCLSSLLTWIFNGKNKEITLKIRS